MNDAPRTTRDLATLVSTRFGGDAARIWKGRSAVEVKETFLSIYGVGENLANMALLLIEKAYKVRFADLDRPKMDIKADVHTIRVLGRLGLTKARTEAAAIAAARELNPEFPGGLDAALWVIGKRWCHARGPRCQECAIETVCPKTSVVADEKTSSCASRTRVQ